MKAKFVYESVFAPKSDEEIDTSLKGLSHYDKTQMLKKAIVNNDIFLIKKLINHINVKEWNVDVRNFDYGDEFRPDHINLTMLKLMLRDKSGEILKLFIDNGFVPLTVKLNVSWEIRKEIEQILIDNIQYEPIIKLLNQQLYDELINDKVKISYSQHFRKGNFNNTTTPETILEAVKKQMKHAFDTLNIPMLNLKIESSSESDPVMWTSEYDHPTWLVSSTAPIMLNGFDAKKLHMNFSKLANDENDSKKHSGGMIIYLRVNDWILRRRDQGLMFEKGEYDVKKLNMLHF
jgi:hypothetical protein